MDSLFTDESAQHQLTPLAERMRPCSLGEVAGQRQVVDVLRELTQRKALPSLILWGPPGCGKTTIARLLAGERYTFVPMSAVLSGVKEVREAVELARQRRQYENKGTLLFLDEIHRFNKAQQDVLLPHVEAGTIVLVGATTENPSFEVVGPLLSRCRVLTLTALSAEDIEQVLLRAATNEKRGLGLSPDQIEDGLLRRIAELAAGDARFALNTLEVCAGLVEENIENNTNTIDTGVLLTLDILKRAVGGGAHRALLYDKGGDEHFNLISALHKSVRGSDPDAGLYWLARMLEAGEDPKYIVRRLIRFASEDIGLADPWALMQANAAREAIEFLGVPECNTALAQLVVYLACAPKSNAMYKSYDRARKTAHNYGALPPPLHIRNAPTKLMKELGYGKDYKYAHDYAGGFVADNYWPDELQTKPPRLLELTGRGAEKTLAERLRKWWGDRFEGEKEETDYSKPDSNNDKKPHDTGTKTNPESTPKSKPCADVKDDVNTPACDSKDSNQNPEERKITQRRLPHWRLDGSVYFVTWRLAESNEQLTEEERKQVQQALRHFNHERYMLYAYCVMDDHVHVVVRQLGQHELGEILQSWKSYTSQKIQQDRGAHGQLWQHESWERIIRDENELIEKCQYTLNNPLKHWPELEVYPWAGWQ